MSIVEHHANDVTLTSADVTPIAATDAPKIIAPESLQESLATDLQQLSGDEEDDAEVTGTVSVRDLKILSDDSIMPSRSNSMRSFQNSNSIHHFKKRIDTLEELIIETKQEEDQQNG